MRFLILFAALLLAACGSQEFRRFPQSLPGQFVGANAKLDTKRFSDTENTLVVLRFPAGFSEQALSRANLEWGAMNKKYIYGGDPSRYSQQARYFLQSPAALAVARTNYYVSELYAALREKIPANRIVLQPETVVIRDGQFAFKGQELIQPSVVLVDFHVSSGRVLLEPASSVGQFMVPVLTARTSRAAAPKTHGALIETRFAATMYQPPASSDRVVDGLGKELVHMLNNPNVALGSNLPASSAWPPKANQILIVPGMTYRLPEQLMKRQSAAPPASLKETPAGSLMRFYAAAITHMLNTVDHEAARKAEKARYVQMFDPQLAARVSAGQESKYDRQKLSDLDGALKEERKIQAALTDEWFKAVYAGRFGQSTRLALAKEMEQYNRLVTQRDTATAIAIMLALAGAAAGAATASGGGYDAGLATAAIAAATTAAIISIQQQSARAQARTKSGMTAAVAGQLEQMREVTVKLRGRFYKIKANNVGDLRQKMIELYRRVYRVRPAV